MHRKNEKNAFEQETMQLNTAAVGNAPAALVQVTAPSENSSPEAAGDSTAENVPKVILNINLLSTFFFGFRLLRKRGRVYLL